jgi:hypothetical protein
MKFGKKRRGQGDSSEMQIVQTVAKDKENSLFASSRFEAQSRAERELYSSLRESVPVIDAAICKIVRLIGKFEIITDDSRAQVIADDFLKTVQTNGSSKGMLGFLYTYLDELLTYGEAVGEMVLRKDGRGVAALYNASLDDVEIKADKSPLELLVCRNDCGVITPVANQNLVLATLLNPKAGTIYGTSVLRSLPFVSSILLRIFSSLKTNWERVGDIRFAVTYNPESSGTVFTKESAKLIADEWKKAMRSDSVCDFVSLGDVSVKVIGAESQMPDCEVPVKQIMEQILAKLGIPPFLLGISWSSTERMSEQQADILTSELEYYRTVVEPVISRVISTQLRLNGYNCGFRIEWNDINLQDAVELSQARLNNAQAMQIEKEIGMEVIDEQRNA